MVPLMDGELALGFALALAAACCYETGYALQAVEARRAPSERALRPSLVAHLVRRPVWVGATALSLVGWPLQIAALTEAPLTLVQPTLALGLLLHDADHYSQPHCWRGTVAALPAILETIETAGLATAS